MNNGTLQHGFAVSQVLRDLAPTGRLRAGVICAPVGGVFFIEVHDSAPPKGVTVDIVQALAADVGTDVELHVFGNSGECTDALAAGDLDVAFMPVDEERARKVDFGPAYYLLRSTLLVAGGSGISTLLDYRANGRRFVGISGTTTFRAAVRSLGVERAVEARTIDAALSGFRRGDVDAVALSEDFLRKVQPGFPGSRVLEQAFQETGIAIAIARAVQQALLRSRNFWSAARRQD